MKCKDCPDFVDAEPMWLGLGICTNKDCKEAIVYDYDECAKENENEDKS
jgi:hypothetical protein